MTWLALAASASVALLVPLVLEWIGAVSPAYQFVSGRIEIVPRVMALPAGPTQILLVVTLIMTVFVACAYAAWFQRPLAEAERGLQLHIWQLRQLISRPVSNGPVLD